MLAAVSLQVGYPTEVSVRQSILRGFKYLVATTMESEYTFKEAQALKEALTQAVSVAAPIVQEKVQEEVVEEKKEEPVDDNLGGIGDIFGGGDDF